jgi:4-amino-4-deoxy-L-arabinose transferase-like glycosyltransferase
MKGQEGVDVHGDGWLHSWWTMAGLAAAALLMIGIDAGRAVFITNDEARFAVLGQDLLTRGDWWFPQLNGIVYHNKPVLLAWLIALCSWPVGHVTQLTATLPSATAAVALVFAIHGLGRALFGPVAARYAALIAMTTEGFVVYARVPLPDMLLAVFLTGALWMLWRAANAPDSRAWLGFYGLTAAAFWAKGPAGFLPLVVAVVWGLKTRRADLWHALRLPWGALAVGVLTAPWWLREFFWGAPAFQEVIVTDYLYWYVPLHPRLGSLVAPLQHGFSILFPWVLLAPAAIALAVRHVRAGGEQREPLRYVLVCATTLFVVVACSQQQRLRYYLPLVSPVSLLAGWWFVQQIGERRLRVPWKVYAATAAALILATITFVVTRAGWLRDLLEAVPTSLGEGLTLAIVILGVVVFLGLATRQNHRSRAFVGAWLCSAVFVVVWYHGETDRRNHAYDFVSLRAAIARQAPGTTVVAAFGVHDLPLSYYFGYPIRHLESAREVREALAGNPAAIAIVTGRAVIEAGAGAPLRVLLQRRFASQDLVVVAAAPRT